MSKRPPFDIHAPQSEFGGTPEPVEEEMPPRSRSKSVKTAASGSEAGDTLTEQDIFNLPDLPPALPETREFCFNGVKKKITVRTDARTDAQQYNRLLGKLMGGEHVENDGKGKIKVKPFKAVSPSGAIELTDAGYIGSLGVLEATVTAPATSLDGWAVLGKKIGARGAQKGWHGINDLVAFALSANNIDLKELIAGDEKQAGEDTPGQTSRVV